MKAGDKAREASTRFQLGSLYDAMPGRREDAVAYKLQAAEIYAAPEIAHRLREGRARSSAAKSLVALDRHDDARAELGRAIQCNGAFGPNAEPWQTWIILHDLERAAGNPVAAAEARCQAITAYADARRDGWEITGPVARFFEDVRLIATAKDPATPPDGAQPSQLEAHIRQELTACSRDPQAQPDLRVLAPPLLAILDGSRDPALAEDPALNYADAVELMLLLEQLPPG